MKNLYDPEELIKAIGAADREELLLLIDFLGNLIMGHTFLLRSITCKDDTQIAAKALSYLEQIETIAKNEPLEGDV